MQDARVALAYAPKDEGRQGVCRWPWAHSLHSAALEGLQVVLWHGQTVPPLHSHDQMYRQLYQTASASYQRESLWHNCCTCLHANKGWSMQHYHNHNGMCILQYAADCYHEVADVTTPACTLFIVMRMVTTLYAIRSCWYSLKNWLHAC